jgi:hypothetical protein
MNKINCLKNNFQKLEKIKKQFEIVALKQKALSIVFIAFCCFCLLQSKNINKKYFSK